jgi:parallel beta-helix repeat protein
LNVQQDRYVDGSNISQLVIANCQNITVSGANLKKTTVGGTIAYSTRCTIENLTIMNNSHGGLFLTQTENILIDDNRISGNGYYPYAQVGGILLQYAHQTNITRNIIYNNSRNGIEFIHSDGCLVYNNWISNNTYYGIFLNAGTGNRIFGNAIGWNEVGNAWDAGEDNQWDNGIDLGNWWSDYNGPGPYEIEGPAGSKDNYPMDLMEPSIEIPIGPEPDYILIGAIAAVVTVAILGVLVVLLRNKGII